MSMLLLVIKLHSDFQFYVLRHVLGVHKILSAIYNAMQYQTLCVLQFEIL